MRMPIGLDPARYQDKEYLAFCWGELNRQLDEIFSRQARSVSSSSVSASGIQAYDNGANAGLVSGLDFLGDSVSLALNGSILQISITTIAHTLLGAKHSDTLAGTVVRGDVIIGNSTPKWARLALGASGAVLKSDGTDAAWGMVTKVQESSGPTTLTIGAVSDGQFLKRSGTDVVGAVTPYCAFPLEYWTAADVVQAVGTDVRLAEFVFDGTDDYPSSLSDLFLIDAETSGTGTTTVFLRDITNSQTIASKAFTDANARAIYEETTFSNLPTGRARMQLRCTVDTLQTLTIGSAKWRRRRA